MLRIVAITSCSMKRRQLSARVSRQDKEAVAATRRNPPRTVHQSPRMNLQRRGRIRVHQVTGQRQSAARDNVLSWQARGRIQSRNGTRERLRPSRGPTFLFGLFQPRRCQRFFRHTLRRFYRSARGFRQGPLTRARQPLLRPFVQ